MLIKGPCRNDVRWFFPCAFAFACILFWWLPSFLLAWLHLRDPIERRSIIISVLALFVFLVGYAVPQSVSKRLFISPLSVDLCERFAFKATLVMGLPALVVGLWFASYRAGLAYGEGNDIPFPFQVILYVHMFFAYMFIGSVRNLEGANRRRVLLAATLVVLPRLLISFHWSRFFVGQTIVVLLMIAIARGWVRLSWKTAIQLSILAAAIVIIPAATRGDRIWGADEFGRPALVDFFQEGSTLGFFQDYRTLHTDCPPLLVSMTEQVIPYALLHLCTIDVGNVHNTPAILSSILTRQDSNDFATGTGSIYILELYLTGGMTAVILGSALFGVSCRWFVEHLGRRSVLSGIWAECLVRALLAPRGNLGYVYERIPTLLLASIGVVVLCHLALILGSRQMPPLPEGYSPGS